MILQCQVCIECENICLSTSVGGIYAVYQVVHCIEPVQHVAKDLLQPIKKSIDHISSMHANSSNRYNNIACKFY